MSKRRSTAWALERAGCAPDEALGRLVRRSLCFSAVTHVRAATLTVAPLRRRALTRIRVEGHEELRSAIDAGRGVVVVSAHLGDFDSAGAWLAARARVPVVAPVAGCRRRSQQRFYDTVRGAYGLTTVRRNRTSLGALAHRLAAGEIVVVMADRRPLGASVPGVLLDRPAAITALPVALVSHSGAAMLSALTWRPSSGSSLLRFERPVGSEPSAQLNHILERITAGIRGAPAQWHVPADPSELPWVG